MIRTISSRNHLLHFSFFFYNLYCESVMMRRCHLQVHSKFLTLVIIIRMPKAKDTMNDHGYIFDESESFTSSKPAVPLLSPTQFITSTLSNRHEPPQRWVHGTKGTCLRLEPTRSRILSRCTCAHICIEQKQSKNSPFNNARF